MRWSPSVFLVRVKHFGHAPEIKGARLADYTAPERSTATWESTMSDGKNVLFLCTGNSARSIMAEAIMNDISINKGRFRGFSAGSMPNGTVNPLAIEQLQNLHLSTAGLRSKSWEEFAVPGAPQMDYLPLDKLDHIALQKHLDDIGRVPDMAANV
jgi:hypothetical protein